MSRDEALELSIVFVYGSAGLMDKVEPDVCHYILLLYSDWRNQAQDMWLLMEAAWQQVPESRPKFDSFRDILERIVG